jgi:predicted PurR-regulated permease PerM
VDDRDKRVTIEFSFNTLFWVLGIILSIWLVLQIKEILVSVLLAFILAMAIAPVVDYFQKKKIPRPLSISVIYLLIVGLIILIFRLIIPPVISQLGGIYQHRMDYIDTVAGYFGSISGPVKANSIAILNRIGNSFAGADFSGIFSSARGILGGLVDAILVFVLSFYFLLSKRGPENLITGYLPKKHQKRTISIYRKISKKMSYWLRGQVFLGLIIFAVNWIGLSIFHVNYALTLAIISGLLEVLPVIGPWIAGILAVTVALTQSPFLALIVAAWYLVVQQLENHIIVPQVMKKSLGISPVVVILAILIGGNLLGIIGILISVPVASAIGILLEEFVKIKETEEANGN